MPYEVIDPKDGEPVGYRLVRGDGDEADAALVFDTIEEGAVWDAGSGRPRSPAPSEELEGIKAERRAGLEAAFVSGCEADFGSPWAAVGAPPTDPRAVALRARAEKYRVKLAAVDAATTEAEVGAVSWT